MVAYSKRTDNRMKGQLRLCKEYSVTGRVGTGKGWRTPGDAKVCKLFVLWRDDQALRDFSHFASGSRPILSLVSVLVAPPPPSPPRASRGNR